MLEEKTQERGAGGRKREELASGETEWGAKGRKQGKEDGIEMAGQIRGGWGEGCSWGGKQVAEPGGKGRRDPERKMERGLWKREQGEMSAERELCFPEREPRKTRSCWHLPTPPPRPLGRLCV